MNVYGFNDDMMHFRYPKDAEKHLLAIKSGLTRSQVCYYHIHILIWCSKLVTTPCSFRFQINSRFKIV